MSPLAGLRVHIPLAQALMSGIVVQWLADPERAPSGDDLANALRIITATIENKSD